MQYVKVDLEGRSYTYAWDDDIEPPLVRGELVVVPGNRINPKPQAAPVIRVLPGPDYDGQIVEILRRA